MGSAAGQQVERVREGREDHLEALERAVAGAGQVAHERGADGAAHAAAEHAEGRPPACRWRGASPRRVRAPRGRSPMRVPSGVRSRGPNPVPPVVTTSPAKPATRSRNAPATSSMPSAVTSVVDHRRTPRRLSRGDDLRAGVVVAGAVGARRRTRRAPWPRARRHRRGDARPSRRGEDRAAPRRPGRRPGTPRCPTTRMSTPAARPRARCRR